MASYIATYDLVGTDVESEEYATLIDAIGRYPAREVQKSVWVLRTNESAMEVFDTLWGYMHPDDRLFVVKLSPQAQWENALCSGDWLKENIV